MSKKNNMQYAFNSHHILHIPFLVIMISLGTFCIIDKDFWLAIVIYAFALLPIFCILISPLCYIFTEQDVTIIYCFGIKEIVKWSEVKDITKYGSWFTRGLPHYRVSYPKFIGTKKQPFFVNGEISCSKKTKKYIKMFYKKEIN